MRKTPQPKTQSRKKVVPVVPVINMSDFEDKSLYEFLNRFLEHAGFNHDFIEIVEFASSEVMEWNALAYTAATFPNAEKTPGRIFVGFPLGFDEQSREDIVELYQVLIHEFEHCCGLVHKDMIDWWDIQVPSWVEAGMLTRRVPIDEDLKIRRVAWKRWA